MKVFSNIKARAKNARLKTKAIAGGFILTIASIAALATMGGAAASPVSTPNCDDNAVVYCGASSVSQLQSKYNNGDGHNKAYTIQDIYHGFGIGPSDISGMSSDSSNGYVTKTGDVYDGNTLVATNAMTAGRENISGSTKEKYGATTYYKRAPSVSFQDSELSAMVVMKGGTFQYAILNSCGNPVTGTPKAPAPTPKPAASISKLVRAAGTSNYSSDVTVKSGSEVQYEIVARSTGNTSADNFTVSDALPSGLTYDANSLEVNGKSANSGAFFSKSGLNLGTVKNGTSETITFNATAGVSCTATSCEALTINNYGYVWANNVPVENSHATVNTTCTKTPPPPVKEIACTGLEAIGSTPESNGDESYTLKATASESNATISKYVFTLGDSSSDVTVNTSSTSAQTTHTYAPGNYTAKVVVSGNAPVANDQTCTTSISVKTPTPVSSLACDDLQAVEDEVNAANGDATYTFTGTASATNATITGYVFDFGDGQSTTVNSSSASANATHTYAPGNYTAKVTVSANNYDGKAMTPVTSAKCEVPIKVSAPAPSSLTCESLTDTAGDVDSSTGDQTYNFTAQASASNATITTYTFDFGDGKSTSGTSTTASHTYAPGNYTATLTVTGKDAAGNTITAPTVADCSVKITVSTPTCQAGQTGTYPNCTTPTCQNGQTGTYPNCTTPTCQAGQTGTYPNCTTPTCQNGQTGTYPNCTTPTCENGMTGTYPNCTTPATSLPNTGAGDTIGLFIGAVMAGTVGFRVFLSRKMARNQ